MSTTRMVAATPSGLADHSSAAMSRASSASSPRWWSCEGHPRAHPDHQEEAVGVQDPFGPVAEFGHHGVAVAFEEAERGRRGTLEQVLEPADLDAGAGGLVLGLTAEALVLGGGAGGGGELPPGGVGRRLDQGGQGRPELLGEGLDLGLVGRVDVVGRLARSTVGRRHRSRSSLVTSAGRRPRPGSVRSSGRPGVGPVLGSARRTWTTGVLPLAEGWDPAWPNRRSS